MLDADEAIVSVTKMVGGMMVAATPKQHDILQMRGAFAKAYCEAKGWNFDNPTIDQILEIRSQRGWINPTEEQG